MELNVFQVMLIGILDLCEPLKCDRFCYITALRTADLTLQSLLDELKRHRAKRYRASELALPSAPPKSFHPLHDTTVNTQEFDPSQYLRSPSTVHWFDPNGTKKSPKTYRILVPSLQAGNQLEQGLYLNLVPFLTSPLIDLLNDVA